MKNEIKPKEKDDKEIKRMKKKQKNDDKKKKKNGKANITIHAAHQRHSIRLLKLTQSLRH